MSDRRPPATVKLGTATDRAVNFFHGPDRSRTAVSTVPRAEPWPEPSRPLNQLNGAVHIVLLFDDLRHIVDRYVTHTYPHTLHTHTIDHQYALNRQTKGQYVLYQDIYLLFLQGGTMNLN